MERLYTGTYCCALLILLIGSVPWLIGSSPGLGDENPLMGRTTKVGHGPSWFVKRIPKKGLSKKGVENGPLVLTEFDKSQSKEHSLALTASALDTSDEVQLQVDMKTKIEEFVKEIVASVKSGTPHEAQMQLITRTDQVVAPFEPKVFSRAFLLPASGKTYTLLVQLTQKATDSASETTLLTLLAEQCKVDCGGGNTGCNQTWIYISDGKWELEAWLRGSLFSEVKVAPVHVVTAFYNIGDGVKEDLAKDIQYVKEEMVRTEIKEKEKKGETDFMFTKGMYGKKFVEIEGKNRKILVSFKYKGAMPLTKTDMIKKLDETWKYMPIGESVENVAFNDEMRVFVMVMEKDVKISGRYLGKSQNMPPLLQIPVAELSVKRYSSSDRYLHASTTSSSGPPAQLTPVTSPLGLTATAFDTSLHVQKWMRASIDNVLKDFNKTPKAFAEAYTVAADGKIYTLLVLVMPKATTRGGAGSASKEDLKTLIAQLCKVEGCWQTWMYVRDEKSELEALLMASRLSQVQEPAVQVVTAFYKVDNVASEINWGEKIEQAKKELVDTHLTNVGKETAGSEKKVETPLSNVVKGAAAGKENEPKSFKNGVHFMKDFKEQKGKVLVSFKYTGTEDLTEEQMSEKANELWKHIPIGKSVETLAFNEEMRIVVMVMQLKTNVPEWYFGEHTSIPLILQIGVEETSLNRYSLANSYLHSAADHFHPFPIPVPQPTKQYQVSHGKDPAYSYHNGIAYVDKPKPISEPPGPQGSNDYTDPELNTTPQQTNQIPIHYPNSNQTVLHYHPTELIPIYDPNSNQTVLHPIYPPNHVVPYFHYNYNVWDPKSHIWVTHAQPIQRVFHMPSTQPPYTHYYKNPHN